MRAPYRLVLGAVLAAAAGGAMGFLSSCSSLSRTVVAPLTIEGAAYVGNRACADCHTNQTRIFAASPHGRYSHGGDIRMAGETGCESCHGPGSLHVKAGGGQGKFILNPGKDPTSCFQCHLEVQAEFHLPQRHPVIEGRMNCVQCHDPHGQDALKPAGGLAMARLNQSCAECHREQAKSFVYEHLAMREGCTACHNVHGSINAKMLLQRDANLCLRCHAQVQAMSGTFVIGKVDHTRNVRFGSCWSAGCHTAVHGSNINPFLNY